MIDITVCPIANCYQEVLKQLLNIMCNALVLFKFLIYCIAEELACYWIVVELYNFFIMRFRGKITDVPCIRQFARKLLIYCNKCLVG